MAKVGYIFKAASYDGFDTDVALVNQYGCKQMIEDENRHEKLRHQWKQLMANLKQRVEIVFAKFSNALRDSRELEALFCRVTVMWITSTHDIAESRGDLFPETTAPYSRHSTNMACCSSVAGSVDHYANVNQ